MPIEVNSKRWGLLPKWGELVAYRDLFLTFTYRDLRVRYAQTILGLFWAILQPVITLSILVLIFGRAVQVDTKGIPYSLFAVCGVAVWTYFAFVMKESGSALIASQEMIRKIYFPRLIIPLGKAMLGLVDLLVALLLLVLLFLYHGQRLGHEWWLALPCLVALIAISLGIGLWIAALTIRARDLQHVVPYLVQFGLFITPVAYLASTVTDTLPGWAQVVYFLNPMAGLVECFRAAMLGIGPPHPLSWVSFVTGAAIFVTGLYAFRRMERTIADRI